VIDLAVDEWPPGSIAPAVMPDGCAIISCPHWLERRSVAVSEAFVAYGWRKAGAFGERYPTGAPLVLMYAVEAVSNGISEGESSYYKRMQKEGSRSD